MMSAIDSFIARHNLLPANSTVIVGLSGGPDSVFLLHLLYKRRTTDQLTIIAAHLDHEWRPNSNHDAQFCQTLCNQWDIPLEIAKRSDLAISRPANGSIEEAGRNARRFFLQQIQQKYNAATIALAHHQDDQQENFFIRLIRGSGLTGLVGMKPRSGAYVRPLLETSKTAILTYLDQHHIPFVIDPTNESSDYLRNRIRATVIPALRSCDARFDQNFVNTLARLDDIEEYLIEQTAAAFNALSTKDNDRIYIAIAPLLALHPVVRYRVILHWLIFCNVPFHPSQAFLDEIIRFLLLPKSTSHQLHRHWRMVKQKDHVYLLNT